MGWQTVTKIVCMRGLPASGKSTIARKLDAVRVSRDDLRMQMFGSHWGAGVDEDAVTIAERSMVESLLKAGHDVVVDATHLNPQFLRYWQKLATIMDVGFEVIDCGWSVEECIERDSQRDRQVGADVIRRMDRRWRKRPNFTERRIHIEPYIPPAGRSKAIIVDIDGTLAHNVGGRSPYDYTRVHEDTVDHVVKFLVNRYYHGVASVLVVSGRDSSCRDETARWLHDNEVKFDRLWMRPDDVTDFHGNKLPDWIVKLNLFNEHIRDNYKVEFVLDDRNSVVKMWRKLGLKCLQVAEGNF